LISCILVTETGIKSDVKRATIDCMYGARIDVSIESILVESVDERSSD